MSGRRRLPDNCPLDGGVSRLPRQATDKTEVCIAKTETVLEPITESPIEANVSAPYEARGQRQLRGHDQREREACDRAHIGMRCVVGKRARTWAREIPEKREVRQQKAREEHAPP